jgi:hypothetical protein
MHSDPAFSTWFRQGGMVLVLAMLFLLLLALVASMAMQTSALEFRMAANDQLREEALQRAEAVVEAIAEDAANFPLNSRVGDTICPVNCTIRREGMLLALNETPLAPVPHAISYHVERQVPLLGREILRGPEAGSFSAVAYQVARFEIRVMIDGADEGLGRVGIARGVAVPVAVDQGQVRR